MKKTLDSNKERKASRGAPAKYTYPDNQDLLAKKIDALRIHEGLFKKAMDKRIPFAKDSYVGKWISGVLPISNEAIASICMAFGIKKILFDASITLTKFKTSLKKKVDTSPEERFSLSPDERWSTNTPNNLEKRYYNLTGREDELSKLLEYLSPQNRDFRCAITGVGGIGKTTLALEAGWECAAEEYFEAVVWFSAKECFLVNNQLQRHPTKSNLNSLLETILLVFSTKEKKEFSSKEELRIAVQDLLSKYRTLIIIDNLESAFDPELNIFITEEIPIPSETLTTDRRNVSVQNIIPLSGFSDKQIREIITKQCAEKKFSLSNDDIDKIILNIGGIPLGIEWAIGQLAIGHWDINKLATHLSGHDSKPILDYLFQNSWDSIQNHSKKVLSLLAFFPFPVSGHLIKEILLFNEDEINDSLGELYRFALILTEQTEDEKRHLTSLNNRFSTLPLTNFFIKKATGYQRSPFTKQISKYLHRLLPENSLFAFWPLEDNINAVRDNPDIFIWIMVELIATEDYQSALTFSQSVGISILYIDNFDTLFFVKLSLWIARKLRDKIEEARILIFFAGFTANHLSLEKRKKDLESGIQLAQSEKHKALELTGIIFQYSEEHTSMDSPRAYQIAEKELYALKGNNKLQAAFIYLGSAYNVCIIRGEIENAYETCMTAIQWIRSSNCASKFWALIYASSFKYTLLQQTSNLTEDDRKALSKMAKLKNKLKYSRHNQKLTLTFKKESSFIQRLLDFKK